MAWKRPESSVHLSAVDEHATGSERPSDLGDVGRHDVLMMKNTPPEHQIHRIPGVVRPFSWRVCPRCAVETAGSCRTRAGRRDTRSFSVRHDGCFRMLRTSCNDEKCSHRLHFQRATCPRAVVSFTPGLSARVTRAARNGLYTVRGLFFDPVAYRRGGPSSSADTTVPHATHMRLSNTGSRMELEAGPG